jgi:molybdate transport system ATP-binding protein
VQAVRARAGAVVIITHDPADAFGVADRIAVMEAGRIVQTGTPDELLAEPGTPFVATFTGAELLLNGSLLTVAEDLVEVGLQGGGTIWAGLAQHRSWRPVAGARVHVAYRPEDVVISSPGATAELSARNQYRLEVAALAATGGLVRLRLRGQPDLTALITRTSCDSLNIRQNGTVIAHLKATALRALPA